MTRLPSSVAGHRRGRQDFKQLPPQCQVHCTLPLPDRTRQSLATACLVSASPDVAAATRARSTYASRLSSSHVACVIGIGGCRCGDRIVRSKYLNSRCQVPLLFSLCFLPRPAPPNFLWRASLGACPFAAFASPASGSHDCAACAQCNSGEKDTGRARLSHSASPAAGQRRRPGGVV